MWNVEWTWSLWSGICKSFEKALLVYGTTKYNMGTWEEYRCSIDLYVSYVIGKPLLSILLLYSSIRGHWPFRVPNQVSNMLLPLITCTVRALTQVKMIKPNQTLLSAILIKPNQIKPNLT